MDLWPCGGSRVEIVDVTLGEQEAAQTPHKYFERMSTVLIIALCLWIPCGG